MPGKVTFLLCFLLLSLLLSGQQNKITSIRQALLLIESTREDSSLQNAYNYLGKSYIDKSYALKHLLDSAFLFIRKGVYLLDSANSRNNPKTNEALCLLAHAYIRANNAATGKQVFNQVINLYHTAHENDKEADTWHRQAGILAEKEMEYETVQSSYSNAANIYAAIGDTTKMLFVHLDLSYFHFRTGKAALAESELWDIIKISKGRHAFILPDAYFQLSVIKRYGGRFEQGVQYALNAERYMRESGDSSSAHHVYGELGLEYEELNKPGESVFWYKKCLEQRMRLNMPQYDIYRTTYLMVVQMLKMKQGKEALALLLDMKRTNPPKGPISLGILSQSMAYCYSSIGNHVLAEKYFLLMNESYDADDINGEVRFISFFDIGRFYVDQHRYAAADPYLQKAFSLVNTTTLSRVKDLHLLMFKVDSASNQYLAAIRHYQYYKELTDSLFNEAKSRQIEELIIRYEVEKKDNSIALAEHQNKLQQGKLELANGTRNWMLAGGVLMLVVICLLVRNAKVKQRANRLLKLQQDEINRQNLSLQQVVEEKEWLVKEIHHRVKNNFHIVQGLLGTQSGYLKSEEAITALADCRHRVQAMSLIHQRLYQSDNLSALNMKAYIHELVNYLSDSFSIQPRIQFRFQIDPIELDLSHSIPLGLILNEAITNSIKYGFPNGRTGIIDILFRRLNNAHLLLTISDNGVGLPKGFDIHDQSSMGLKLMHGLSEDIEGRFTINGACGTTIEVDFIYIPEDINQYSLNHSTET